MSDKETSGIGRWSQRKTAHRKQKPRSRGPRITFADDVVDDSESGPLLSEPLKEPSATVEAKAASSEIETVQEPSVEEDSPEDDSPEALDNLAKEHDLAPLDSLSAGSDFKPYMQGGIPDMLKQAAMRKLWRVDPAFGFLDGMNDYDEDFRVIDKLITAMDTSYKVGRGFLDDSETDGDGDAIGDDNRDDVESAEPVVDASPPDNEQMAEQHETNSDDSDIGDNRAPDTDV